MSLKGLDPPKHQSQVRGCSGTHMHEWADSGGEGNDQVIEEAHVMFFRIVWIYRWRPIVGECGQH